MILPMSMNEILEEVHFDEIQPHMTGRFSDLVYRYVLTKLVFPDDQRQLRLGDKITEHEIAAELGVSNGPVRDAMIRLRREGWITTQRSKGSFIIDFTQPEISRQIYEFRLVVETGAFYTLAQTITGEQLAELKQIQRRIEQAVNNWDLQSYRKADAEFHLRVIEMAGGQRLRKASAAKLLQWFALSRRVLEDTISVEQSGVDTRSIDSEILSRPDQVSHSSLINLLERHDSNAAAKQATHHCCFVAQTLGIEKRCIA